MSAICMQARHGGAMHITPHLDEDVVDMVGVNTAGWWEARNPLTTWAISNVSVARVDLCTPRDLYPGTLVIPGS